jgi:signal transduction histidine kinase
MTYFPTENHHNPALFTELHSRLQDIRAQFQSEPQRALILLQELELEFPEGSREALLAEIYECMARCLTNLGEPKSAAEIIFKGLEIAEKTAPETITHAQLLKNLGDIDFARGLHSRAKEHYEKALDINRKIGHNKGETLCLVCLGNCFTSLGDIKAGLKFLREGLYAAREIGHYDAEITALIGKGNAYTFLGMFAEALEILKKALALSEQQGDQKRLASVTINIALAFQRMGNLDDALVHYHRALTATQLLKDRQREGIILLNLGSVNFLKGDLEEALKYFFKSLEVREEVNDIAGIGSCCNNIGTVLTELGRYEEGKDYLLKSLEIRHQTKNLRGEATSLNALGYVFHLSGENEVALGHLVKAVEIATNLDQPDLIHECETTTVKVLKALGRHEEALFHAETGFEAYKKMFNSQAEARATNLRIQFETEQAIKDAEIERLKNIELVRANEQLQTIGSERQDFISIAAHDLRNPLHSMKIILNILKTEETGLKDEFQMYLQEIDTSATNMLDLIENLLDTEIIESGRLQLAFEPFRAGEILRAVIARYDSAALLKDLIFHIDTDPQLYILADVRYVMQVLDNVISNAVKYSPFGKNIYARLFKNGSMVRIEIQDEGAGFKSDEMQKLFGKFQRLSARPTAGEHSTGLGLSIAKKLTEAMNGRIWAESEAGRGSTFFLEFPLFED